MLVTAIAAMDRAGLIGNGLKMPWHLPADLKRFRKLTLGKPVILGRKTLQSLGKPLDGRLNIVLSRDHSFDAPGCRVAGSIAEALQIAEDSVVEVENPEVMIIGGGVIYEATCPLWDRLFLTIIEAEFPGDTFFPVKQVDSLRWELVNQENLGTDKKNHHPHTFFSLKKQKGDAITNVDFTLSEYLAERTISESSFRD